MSKSPKSEDINQKGAIPYRRRRDEMWRIERAEARNVLACARGRASCIGTEAVFRSLAGGYAVFAGGFTHLNQGVAIGMSKAVEAGDVARVTTFFSDRDVAPTVHVSDQIPAIRNQFLRQGYRETGENRILAFRLRRDVPPDAPQDNDVHRLQPNEKWDWVQAVAQGFLEKVETTADDVIVGETVYRAATDHFLVRSNSGEIAGTAGFAQRSGVGVFFADSTRPQYRFTGIQGRLIRTRLLHAKRAGCDLVTATVAPGGASEKNYLRCGFQILYSRITLEHSGA